MPHQYLCYVYVKKYIVFKLRKNICQKFKKHTCDVEKFAGEGGGKTFLCQVC